MLPKFENLSMEQHVYRFKVVRTFLKAGVPINKIDQFRSLSEEEGYSLTHSSHFNDMIDVISREESERVKNESLASMHLLYLTEQLLLLKH